MTHEHSHTPQPDIDLWPTEDTTNEVEAPEEDLPLDEIYAGMSVIAHNGKDSGEARLMSDKLKGMSFTINGTEHTIASIRYDEHELPMIGAYTVTERPQDSEMTYYALRDVAAARTIDAQLAQARSSFAPSPQEQMPADNTTEQNHTPDLDTVTGRIAAHQSRSEAEQPERPAAGEKLRNGISRLKRKIARSILTGPAADLAPVVQVEENDAPEPESAPAQTEADERQTAMRARAEELAANRQASEQAPTPTTAEHRPIPQPRSLGDRIVAARARQEQEREAQAIPVTQEAAPVVPLPVRTRQQPDAHFGAPIPVTHEQSDTPSTDSEHDSAEPLPPMTRVQRRAYQKKLQGRQSGYRSRRTDR